VSTSVNFVHAYFSHIVLMLWFRIFSLVLSCGISDANFFLRQTKDVDELQIGTTNQL
jgi:hypothetical protein